MKAAPLTPRLALGVSAVAIAALGTLTACGTAADESPDPTTTPRSGSPSPVPNQKDMRPGGPNSFTPTNTARPPQTAIPGNHHGHLG